MKGYYGQWVSGKKATVVSYFNNLLKGNISVSQAHVERDEIVSIFNELGEELDMINRQRQEAEIELRKTQAKLRAITMGE